MSRKPRYLAHKLEYRFPRGKAPGWEEFYLTLLDSLDEGAMSGDYPLPRGWTIAVLWRNSPRAPWRSGPWATVQEESAGTSGWDSAMRLYLHDRLREVREAREARNERALEVLERQYRERDEELRRRNAAGELSDIRTTIERTRARQQYEAAKRKLRGDG